MDKQKNLQIEGLRGFSIILIVTYHVFCRFAQLYRNTDIFWMKSFGSFGVGVFFIISAFFFIDSHKSNPNFSILKFYFKRFIRLWPIFFISMTCTFLLTSIFPLDGRTVHFKDYILNIFLLNRLFGSPYVEGAHWFLNILVSFIIIMGFAKKFKLETNFLFYLGVGLFLFIINKTGISALYNALGGPYIGYLFIGVALKMFMLKYSEMKKLERCGWGIIIVYGFLIIYNYLSHSAAYCVIMAILFMTLCSINKMRVFELIFFQKIGKISYPLYLIHQNISFLIMLGLMNKTGLYSHLYGFFSMIICFFVALILYKLDNVIHAKIKVKK